MRKKVRGIHEVVRYQLLQSNRRQAAVCQHPVLLEHLTDRRMPENMVVLSDDAGQFDVRVHALCRVHFERNPQKNPRLHKTAAPGT
jgi:hypothetical protein